MIRRTTALLVFALTACCAVGALAQDDDARAQAREQFNLGVARYEAGNYQAALEAFQEAYRIAPHPNVRVNMANAYEQLGRPLEALHHFERFLAESERPTAQQRREVEGAIRRLEERLGSVRLSVTPDGAEITIDNAETRRAPVLEPVRLIEGTHHITVRLDGYRTQHEEIQVQGGAEQRVAIRLERGEDQPAVAAAEPAPDDAAPAQATADPIVTADAAVGADDRADPLPPLDDGGGWQFRATAPVIVAGSATAAFLVTMAVTGGLAMAYNAEYEDAVVRYEDPSSPPEVRAQASRDGLAAADTADTLSVVSDAFLIGSILAAGATVFFVIVGGMEEDEEDTMASDEGFELRAAPSVGREGGGLMLQGRF